MADKTNLIKALRSLDAENPNHWTTDGLARLDTVRMVAADQTITREDVETHAPGFVKATAKTWVEPAEDAEGAPAGVPVPITEDAAERLGVETAGVAGTNVDAEGTPSGVPTQLTEGMVPAPPEMDAEDGLKDQSEKLQTEEASDGGASDAPDDGEAEQSEVVQPGAGEDEVSSLEAELAEVQEQLTQGRTYIQKANKALDELARREAEIHDKLTTLRPVKPGSDAVSQYLASRRRQVEERGDVRQIIKAGGVDFSAIQKAIAPAPIDAAMARKRGHGQNRPQRPAGR